MAKKPAKSTTLRVVADFDTDFTDLIEAEAAALNEQLGESLGTDDDALPIDLEEVLGELRSNIDAAVDFMQSKILPDLTRAEEFYNGETDITTVPNRSAATQTVVRDAIRAIKPNVMRIFTQVPEIVVYKAADTLDFAASSVAQAQTSYVNQLFWSSGGYLSLLNTAHNSLLKKVGILKSHFSRAASDEYINITSATPEQLEALQQMPDTTVISAEQDEVTGLLRVEVALRRSGGEITLEDVLLHEFFVDEAATNTEDALVIGQRRSVTVGYARSIGLEYLDGEWTDLDDYDAEMNEASESSETRRGYVKNGDQLTSVDETKHKFLLTEVYASFDLDGTGIPQLYRFWLGGTTYEYLSHERVEENPYSAVCSDPIPGSFFGGSIYDVLMEEQNTQTSLMRATIDNAHLANNRRLAFHDTLVNIQDVMNPAIGAPIRFRQPGMIQEIGVESTLGTMLPLMQYLQQNGQTKAGVTNAAMGLDPDAMQSTDKDAVRNTIQLSLGQVELICRNMAETGLRSAFTKLLKLSLRHKPREQVIFSGGVPIPVDQAVFNPAMRMEVAVGMGTGNVETRIGALQMVIGRQEVLLQTYGLSNPLCNVQHHMNAIVDLGSLMGLQNMGRYFNQPTPEIAQQLDQATAEMKKAQEPEPPSQAVAIAEQIRAQSRLQERQMIMQSDAEKMQQEGMQETAKLLTDDDFRRDKMEQDLLIARMRWLGEQIRDAEQSEHKDMDRTAAMQRELLNLVTTLANRNSDSREGVS